MNTNKWYKWGYRVGTILGWVIIGLIALAFYNLVS